MRRFVPALVAMVAVAAPHAADAQVNPGNTPLPDEIMCQDSEYVPVGICVFELAYSNPDPSGCAVWKDLGENIYWGGCSWVAPVYDYSPECSVDLDDPEADHFLLVCLYPYVEQGRVCWVKRSNAVHRMNAWCPSRQWAMASPLVVRQVWA